jgi:HSP20 family molecular chaperone IbpA
VDWAGLEDGILSIGLTRNIPEEKKPKKITIS